MIQQKKGKLAGKEKPGDTSATRKPANPRSQRDRALVGGRDPASQKRLAVMKRDLLQGPSEMAAITENGEPTHDSAQLPPLQDRQLSMESGSSLERVARGGAKPKPPAPWSIGAPNTKNQKLKALELAKNRGASMRQLAVVNPIPEDGDWRLPKIAA